jgi:uncharacterized protein YprB with RNaseH-like and TPR domain
MRSLRERLIGLRRRPFEPRDSGEAAALRDRVARLRPDGHRHSRERGFASECELAGHLGARWLEDGLLLVERTYPLDFSHGRSSFTGLQDCSSAAIYGGCEVPVPSMAFVDTETTGLAGGTGTVVFLLGIARLGDGQLQVSQLLLTRFAAEPPLLDAAVQRLDGTSALVSYNGKGFDLPLLAARHRMHARADPFAGRRAHLDLLYPTRRAFGSVWADCRLQTAERELVGLRREGDIPGFEIPQVWFDLVGSGSVDRLPAVLEHNRLDLLSLAALIIELPRVFADPARFGADGEAIGRGYLREGDELGALRCLRAARDQLTETGLLELARLYRRRGDWAEAVQIWERLAARGSAHALVQLSKYHEHLRRDPRRALEFAHRLIALEGPGHDHERRVARLRRRLGRLTDDA